MDKKFVAFESLEARAHAQKGDPLDRIAVRDYVKAVDIGAFQSERGVFQNIRFNVVLEVAHSAAAATDDVDQVLSYDTITEAIDHQLEIERLNLLETLAERIAAELLTHRRAQRAFIRIEKMDRIDGTLGIEIVRSRADAENVVALEETEIEPERAAPTVLFLPNIWFSKDRLAPLLDKIETSHKPVILCVEMAEEEMPKSASAFADRRIKLLSVEQNAWVLAGLDPRCVVIDSRTELEHTIRLGQISVWAPSKMVLDATEKPALDATPEELALWLAEQFEADGVYCLKSDETRAGFAVINGPEDIV
ncbi:MAG: dihydroneopterin aldolase [Pseudomonadota bacterium]